MTEERAILQLRYRIDTATSLCGKGADGKAYEDMEMAIKALEEIQQYREIGTVEECREAVERSNGCGWVSVDEGLPEDFQRVLVWYEYFRYGDYNCMYQTYGIGYQLDGHWSGSVSGHKARCIAWQPLPEPYRCGKKEMGGLDR